MKRFLSSPSSIFIVPEKRMKYMMKTAMQLYMSNDEPISAS
jgi:hypothetical protein